MSIPYIFNIQKFSIHDGPGIRTTVFFKGCPIRCAWCHNPESQSFELEEMETKYGNKETVGKQYTIEELVKELKKDQIFYEQSGGGVTLSGGECLAQSNEYITSLVMELHRVGIDVAIDTCGVVSYDRIQPLLPYVQLFLYDLKFLDSTLHQKYTGAPNDLVLDNLKKLSEAQTIINLRMIMLDGLNADNDTIQKTIDYLVNENINVDSINLLPYHSYGRDKYRRLQMGYDEDEFKAPSEDRLQEIQKMFQNKGFKTAIGGSKINKVS